MSNKKGIDKDKVIYIYICSHLKPCLYTKVKVFRERKETKWRGGGQRLGGEGLMRRGAQEREAEGAL